MLCNLVKPVRWSERVVASSPIKPFKEWGVGKRVGKFVYVHKSALTLMPQQHLEYCAQQFHTIENNENFSFDVVKLALDLSGVTFVRCSGFDKEDEPALDYCMTCKTGEKPRFRFLRGNTIYHHKWVMVAMNYQGFDTVASLERTQKILECDYDSTRIGSLAYWNKTVLPQLRVF